MHTYMREEGEVERNMEIVCQNSFKINFFFCSLCLNVFAEIILVYEEFLKRICRMLMFLLLDYLMDFISDIS